MMSVDDNFRELVHDGEARTTAYSEVNAIARDMLHGINTALAIPDDIAIPGWRIKRIYVHRYGVTSEMRLCESTEPNMPFTLEGKDAEDISIIVHAGVLRISYDDGTFEQHATAGKMFFLPSGIKRTTIAVEHPTVIFALLCGRPDNRERDISAERVAEPE